MRKSILLVLIFLSLNCFGNLNFIELKKIPNSEDLGTEFQFLHDNIQYIDHWEMEWNYDVNKNDISDRLKKIHKTLSKIDSENQELLLLLGDVSFFLYNLVDEPYFQLAVDYYTKAIHRDSGDYRAYWFLANHYAKGNAQLESIDFFLKAQRLLPIIDPAEFWIDYSFATMVANMPSHTIFAMDQAKALLGRPSFIEEQLGHTVRNRIVPVNSDSTYHFRDLWTASKADMINFISRPFGMKILIDSTWRPRFFNYDKNMSFVTFIPEPIGNEAGRNITYTIMFVVKVPSEGETLGDFINQFVSKYPDIQEGPPLKNYPSSISMELRNPEMYADIGGAHMRVVGIERSEPQYPGLLLEKPMKIPSSPNSEPAFYRAGNSLDRFKGRIFYAVMLDACEDIYDQANAVFTKVLSEQAVIE